MPVSLLLLAVGPFIVASRNATLHGPSERVTLRDGTTVEIAGIQDESRGLSWSAVGRPQPKLTFSFERVRMPKTLVPPKTRRLVIRITRRSAELAPGVLIRISLRPPVKGENFIWLQKYGIVKPEEWMAGLDFPPQPAGTKANVDVNVANGPWALVSKVLFRHGARVGHESWLLSKPKTEVDTESDRRFSIQVKLSQTVLDRDHRLVAIDRGGKEMASSGLIIPKNPTDPTSYWFLGKATEIRQLQLQARPFEHISFGPVIVGPSE